MNAKFLSVAQEAVRLHLEQNDFDNAYEITKHALEIDPQEPEMLLLMARVMKLAKRPGLKAYARNIMPYLEPDDKEQLQYILQTGQ